MSDYKFIKSWLDKDFAGKEDQIKTIVEFGSRDGLDAIYLAKNFKQAKVYTFECSPRQIKLCQENIKKSNAKDRIIFINACVSDKEEERKFYFYPENAGASSLYIHNDKKNEKDFQLISTTLANDHLSKLGVDSIDLLCMDIQGHELYAMIGLGELLNTVKYIQIETLVGNNRSYRHSPLRSDTLKVLENFTPLDERVSGSSGVETNIIYKNNNLLM